MASNNNGINSYIETEFQGLQLFPTDLNFPYNAVSGRQSYINDVNDGDADFLTLKLSTSAAAPTLPDLPFTRPSSPILQRRERKKPSNSPPGAKSAIIAPPYPWSDVARATVRSLHYLRANQITTISGDVHCKNCKMTFQVELDLEKKFREVREFVAENKAGMHHRAPKEWKNPPLVKCGLCNQDQCVKPVISDKKRTINWLFLFLGQMLGLCTLEQLKYFCKHTKNHSTGAKDRVLFLAYLGLCKQLDPTGPYNF